MMLHKHIKELFLQTVGMSHTCPLKNSEKKLKMVSYLGGWKMMGSFLGLWEFRIEATLRSFVMPMSRHVLKK